MQEAGRQGGKERPIGAGLCSSMPAGGLLGERRWRLPECDGGAVRAITDDDDVLRVVVQNNAVAVHVCVLVPLLLLLLLPEATRHWMNT